jgi:hypothetical protein
MLRGFYNNNDYTLILTGPTLGKPTHPLDAMMNGKIKRETGGNRIIGIHFF